MNKDKMNSLLELVNDLRKLGLSKRTIQKMVGELYDSASLTEFKERKLLESAPSEK